MTGVALPAGRSLTALRALASLSLADTAVLAGTSVAYLSNVETGVLVPTTGYVAQVAAAIAEVLGAPKSTALADRGAGRPVTDRAHDRGR